MGSLLSFILCIYPVVDLCITFSTFMLEYITRNNHRSPNVERDHGEREKEDDLKREIEM